jgi:hypothetical protein
MNTKNKIGRWLGALLVFLCIICTPLHASNVNVIGEKDTTIIFFLTQQVSENVTIQTYSEAPALRNYCLIERPNCMVANGKISVAQISSDTYPTHAGIYNILQGTFQSTQGQDFVDKNSVSKIKKEDLYDKLTYRKKDIV